MLRSRWPWSRRSPTDTATRATATLASSSSTSDERKASSQRGHRRAAVGGGHLADRLHLGLRPPEDLQRREARDHVEEVAGEVLQRPHPPGRRVPGGHPDEHHEQGDERHRDGDDGGRDPVLAEHRDQHDQGHDDREDELGQVPGEVAVERVDALGGEHREVAGPALGQTARPERGDVLGERRPEIGLHPGRRAVGRDLRVPGHAGAKDDDDEQRPHHTAEVVQTLAVDEGPGHGRREQPGLGHDEERGDGAEDHGQEQVRPRRSGVVQQPRVDRAPGVVASSCRLGRRRRPASGGPSAGTGAPHDGRSQPRAGLRRRGQRAHRGRLGEGREVGDHRRHGARGREGYSRCEVVEHEVASTLVRWIGNRPAVQRREPPGHCHHPGWVKAPASTSRLRGRGHAAGAPSASQGSGSPSPTTARAWSRMVRVRSIATGRRPP